MSSISSTRISTLKNHENISVSADVHLKSAFFNQAQLDWRPWVMPETHFKLLGINTITGGFTMMLKVGANNVAPVHGHLGAVEGIILEGGFAYEDDWGLNTYYVQEPAGINHTPRTGPDGMIMFAIAHGPLLGFNEDGTVAMVLDARKMYELAATHQVADHIDPPLHWQE